MADLWRDGDLITAAKLNRIVFANETVVFDENERETGRTLDITPNDIFDENNNCTAYVIVRSPFVTDTEITTAFCGGIVLASYYPPADEQISEYALSVPVSSGYRMYRSETRDGYFTYTKTGDEGSYS